MGRLRLAVALAAAGLVLAACGGSRHVVGVTAYPWPEGPPCDCTFGTTAAGVPGLPFDLVARTVPAKLPERLPQLCAGGAIVEVTLSDHHTIRYGPCRRPAAIERLFRSMIAASRAFFAQPITGAPAGTPMWLTEMAWHEAVGLGDPRPEKIAVTLGVVDRYGRVLDRVWMRGNFTCRDCGGLNVTAPPAPGRHIGFAVIAKTHQLLSWHFQGR